MARYLLIAHQRAERQELLDAAKELAAQDVHARFTLLVHATAVADLPMYDREATERHFEKTLALWRRNLHAS